MSTADCDRRWSRWRWWARCSRSSPQRGPAVASAEPPDWWYRHTGAGPPLFVPNPDTQDQEPPYDKTAPDPIRKRGLEEQVDSFFGIELAKNTAEIVVLRYDLDPSKHLKQIGGTVLQTLLVWLFFAGAPECGFPAALIKLHDYLSKAQDGAQGLNLVQQQLRLNADEQYVAWLYRWYSRFDPGLGKHGSWNTNPKWVHNPKPPPPNCLTADPANPPSPGCVRVTVRVIPAPLPADPSNESIGEGVGERDARAGGKDNPESEPAGCRGIRAECRCASQPSGQRVRTAGEPERRSCQST